MASDSSVRYTIPRGQQSTPLIGVVVLVLVGAIAGLFGGLGLAVPFVMIAVFVLIIWFLVMYGSYAVLDEDGIRSKRGVFRHAVAWSEVREVKPDPKSGEVLVVHRTRGRPFKLGAPISGGLSQDPEYRAKVAQVLAFVKARTG